MNRKAGYIFCFVTFSAEDRRPPSGQSRGHDCSFRLSAPISNVTIRVLEAIAEQREGSHHAGSAPRSPQHNWQGGIARADELLGHAVWPVPLLAPCPTTPARTRTGPVTTGAAVIGELM